MATKKTAKPTGPELATCDYEAMEAAVGAAEDKVWQLAQRIENAVQLELDKLTTAELALAATCATTYSEALESIEASAHTIKCVGAAATERLMLNSPAIRQHRETGGAQRASTETLAKLRKALGVA